MIQKQILNNSVRRIIFWSLRNSHFFLIIFSSLSGTKTKHLIARPLTEHKVSVWQVVYMWAAVLQKTVSDWQARIIFEEFDEEQKMTSTLHESKSDPMNELLSSMPVSPIWPRRSSGSRKVGVSSMGPGSGGLSLGNSRLKLRKWSAPILGSFRMR